MNLFRKRLEHAFPERGVEIDSLCVVISIFSIGENDRNVLCDWLVANCDEAEKFLDTVHWTPYNEAGKFVENKIAFIQGKETEEKTCLFFGAFERVSRWLLSFLVKRPEEELRMR